MSGDYFRDVEHPVARKAHQCVYCFAAIPVGEKYKAQSGFYDGRAFRNKFHVECFDTLSENGEFEFCPGDGEPPERLTSAPSSPPSSGSESGK